jgi:Bacterial PH domain
MVTMFRSKIDGKLIAVGIIMPCVALAAIAASPRPAVLWVPAMAIVVATIVVATIVVVWVILSTFYEFEGEALVAHSGPFSWRIPLKEISAVRESNSVRSGPALSMDRLEITYRNGRVLLISPEDKPGFLAALRRRAPQLAS